jgi:transposase
MIDASHIKVHPHAAGARGGNQDMARTRGIARRYAKNTSSFLAAVHIRRIAIWAKIN